MLEQAIVDAEALKEAALKNAEQVIIEKYQTEVKQAIDTLLEQDEMGAPDEEVDRVVQDMPLAAGEGANSCPCPDEETLVTINLPQLQAQMEEEMAEEGELAAEEMGTHEELGGELEGLEEELELDEDMLSELLEELEVDITPAKSGWLETPSAEIAAGEEEAEAADTADDDEDDEEGRITTALHETLEKVEEKNVNLRIKNNNLLKQNNKFKESILQLKDTINEVILQNAKLLYANKTLSNISLNERQKNQIVEAISKASTVEESKVIYETLQSTVGVSKSNRNKRPESLNEAVSRRSSTLLSSRKEVKPPFNPHTERMKKLAGIT
jgi:hypothetical protein